MRNFFTITISDARGARQFTFQQFVKKFALYFVLVFVSIWISAMVAMFWYIDRTQKVETQHQAMIQTYFSKASKAQEEYERILVEKTQLESSYDEKSAKMDLLGQKLQDFEELVHGSEQVKDQSAKELEVRLQDLQMSSVTKMTLLNQIPSGSAVKKFTRISSSYGSRVHPVTGLKHKHSGMDYAGKVGDPVVATADGVVFFSGKSKNTGFGKLITIAHAHGFKTRYGHLHKLLVKSGEFVRKGQVIAQVGNTGRSTGSHLHYEVMFLTKRINPRPFHDWSIENYNQIFTEVKGIPWASLVQATEKNIQQLEKQLLQQDAKLVASSKD